jgi:hypothetical protein
LLLLVLFLPTRIFGCDIVHGLGSFVHECLAQWIAVCIPFLRYIPPESSQCGNADQQKDGKYGNR